MTYLGGVESARSQEGEPQCLRCEAKEPVKSQRGEWMKNYKGEIFCSNRCRFMWSEAPGQKGE